MQPLPVMHFAPIFLGPPKTHVKGTIFLYGLLRFNAGQEFRIRIRIPSNKINIQMLCVNLKVNIRDISNLF